MNEKPLEWITIKEENATSKIARILSLVALIAGALLAMMTFNVAILILTAALVALFIYFKMNMFVEFEFTYMVDEFEVAKIYNHSRRKKKFGCVQEEIEYITKGADNKRNTSSGGGQVLTFYDKSKADEVYTMVVNKGGKKTIIFFEPEEEFIQILQKKWKVR
ncbi:hypothetical protein LQZ18_18675 [Lachnospiraceae bacterium ZAX-1]